jgi:hypothetical protein
MISRWIGIAGSFRAGILSFLFRNIPFLRLNFVYNWHVRYFINIPVYNVIKSDHIYNIYAYVKSN